MFQTTNQVIFQFANSENLVDADLWFQPDSSSTAPARVPATLKVSSKIEVFNGKTIGKP